jgi:hypothetical protein
MSLPERIILVVGALCAIALWIEKVQL